MPEQVNSGVSIERIDNLSIVSLKVSRKSLEDVHDRLQLAPSLSVGDGGPHSLWVGPDHWLLVSDSRTPDDIIDHCGSALGDILHNAVNNSAGLAVFRISGSGSRDLLASGTGIDLRPQKFATGSCVRTRLAQIAAVIVARAPEQFEIYVDRSYDSYVNAWLEDSASLL